MFFSLSKLLWLPLQPANLVLLSLLLGVVLLYTRWRRAGRRLLSVLAGACLIVATLPVGGWMLVSLENRFPPPDLAPDSVDGVVVLGGAVNQFLTEQRGQLAAGGSPGRLAELLRLAEAHPRAKIVFSGGSGDYFNQDIKEADVLLPYVERFGLAPARLQLENMSRNTYENAVLSLRLARPQSGQRWVLVTSAFHMPRAMGAFRQAGWPAPDLIAYPVDYHHGPAGPDWPMFDLGHGLGGLSTGVHEWLGLVAYRVAGRSAALFPAPMLGRNEH